MIMKRKLGLINAFAALALNVDFSSPKGLREYGKSKQTDEQRKQRLASQEAEINQAKGLKEFEYGENKLWALNQKSADKKAKKRGWIK